MSDDVTVNPGSGGDVIAADEISGVKYQRNKIVFGDDGVNEGDVSTANPLPVELMAATVPGDVIGTVQGPDLTKGTQGATGMSVQDLKDAGRAIVNCSTVIGGVTCVTAEALLAMDVSRSGAATASETTHAVTSGKRWRIQSIVVGIRSSSAAVNAARFALRMNPSGACTTTDPIVLTFPLSSGDALANAGKELVVTIPDGIEFSGTQQWGLTQICGTVNGFVFASVVGFEF